MSNHLDPKFRTEIEPNPIPRTLTVPAASACSARGVRANLIGAYYMAPMRTHHDSQRGERLVGR
jgi:hypothetical protein